MDPEQSEEFTFAESEDTAILFRRVEEILRKRWHELGFTDEEIASWDEEERRKQIRRAIPPPADLYESLSPVHNLEEEESDRKGDERSE